jgi:hypothetical protein
MCAGAARRDGRIQKGAAERFNTKEECLYSLSGRLARRSGGSGDADLECAAGGSVHGNEELGGSAYGCMDALVRAVGSEARV